MENTISSSGMRVLDVAFDVSSERLDGAYQLGNALVSVTCENATDAIRGS